MNSSRDKDDADKVIPEPHRPANPEYQKLISAENRNTNPVFGKDKCPADKSLEIKLEQTMVYARAEAFLETGIQHLRPFSRHFRVYLRKMLPQDEEALNNADLSFRRALLNAVKMRFLTFVLYLLTAYLFVEGLASMVATAGAFTGETGTTCAALAQDQISGAYGLLSSLVAAWFDLLGERTVCKMPSLALFPYMFAGVVIYLTRGWIRHHYNKEIGSEAAEMSNILQGAINRLLPERDHAVTEAKKPRTNYVDGPERSGEWAKVALWLDERMQQLDRYFTAIGWKIQSRFINIQDFFSALNILVTLIALFVAYLEIWPQAVDGPFYQQITIAAVIFAAAYTAFTILFWTLRSRGGNERFLKLLQEKFRAGGNADDKTFNDTHIFNIVAQIVTTAHDN